MQKHGLSKDKVAQFVKDFRNKVSTLNLFEQDIDDIEEKVRQAEKKIKTFAESILLKQETAYEFLRLSEEHVDGKFLLISKDQTKEISKLKEEINNALKEKDSILSYQKFTNENNKNYCVIAEIKNKQEIEESSVSEDTIFSLKNLKEADRQKLLKALSKPKEVDKEKPKKFNFKIAVIYNDKYKSYHVDVLYIMLDGSILQSGLPFQYNVIDLPFAVSMFEKLRTIAQNKAQE